MNPSPLMAPTQPTAVLAWRCRHTSSEHHHTNRQRSDRVVSRTYCAWVPNAGLQGLGGQRSRSNLEPSSLALSKGLLGRGLGIGFNCVSFLPRHSFMPLGRGPKRRPQQQPGEEAFVPGDGNQDQVGGRDPQLEGDRALLLRSSGTSPRADSSEHCGLQQKNHFHPRNSSWRRERVPCCWSHHCALPAGQEPALAALPRVRFPGDGMQLLLPPTAAARRRREGGNLPSSHGRQRCWRDRGVSSQRGGGEINTQRVHLSCVTRQVQLLSSLQ